jgi:hypothetical protein
MNEELKAIFNEFLIKIENYLTVKNEDLDKKIAVYNKLIAKADDAKLLMEEIEKLKTQMVSDKEAFQKEKDLFNDRLEQFKYKEKSLQEKAARIQMMFNS